MYFGAAYYPEHLDRDQIRKDAELMAQCGINLVRMGEFAWVKMEPREGKFDFSWLDDAIEVLAQKGIKTLLCTPTATPPIWLTHKHPDIYQTLSDGNTKSFGKRRHYCVANKNYYHYTKKIVTALAIHYRDNQNVIGYQIDNEFMAEEPYCYCENCRRKFQESLAREYGTVENLNEKWGMIFWGQCYNSWEQIVIPRSGHSPSALLDFRRFASDSFIEFCSFQRSLIKEVSPHKTVTHNICSSGFLYLMDLYKLGASLDIISMDNYPLGWNMDTEYSIKDPTKPLDFDYGMTSLALSITRSSKRQNFWITEAQANRTSGQDTPVDPGLVRLWTYQEVAHGATMVNYFPWRTCPFGSEQQLHGIISYDSKPRRTYFEVQKTINELRKAPITKPQADVAIIRDFQCDWAFEDDKYGSDFKYMKHILLYYDALVKNHATVDIVPPLEDISKYKLVIAPSLQLTDTNRTEKLYEYVKKGGTLILTCLTGIKNMNSVFKKDTLPAELRELAGVEICEQFRIFDGDFKKIDIENKSFGKDQYECATWQDVLKTTTALPLAFKNADPIITTNKYGKGVVYYIGTLPSIEFMREFMSALCFDCGINIPVTCSDKVEIVRVSNEKAEYIYAINYSNETQIISTKNAYTNLKNGTVMGDTFELGALDGMILLLENNKETRGCNEVE